MSDYQCEEYDADKHPNCISEGKPQCLKCAEGRVAQREDRPKIDTSTQKSTLDVIIAVKESQPLSESELRLCVLSLSSLLHFTEEYLSDLAKHEPPAGSSFSHKIAFTEANRWIVQKFKVQKGPMMTWLGANNIPGNPEYEQSYQMFKNIYKDATGDEL